MVAFKWLCFEEAFIYAFMCYFYFFIFIFFSKDQLTKQKKMLQKKANTYIAAIFDHRTIELAMEKVVYIVCAYIKRTPDICGLLDHVKRGRQTLRLNGFPAQAYI